MSQKKIKNIIEAALMVSTQTLSIQRLMNLFDEDKVLHPDRDSIKTAINDLQTDSSTMINGILAERMENYIRGYVDRKNFTELYSIEDSSEIFVRDILKPFIKDLPSNYELVFQSLVNLYSKEMHITGELRDDQFKFYIFLPGAILTTNADSIAGDTLMWTFGLKEFLNDDYILQAESIVYSKKRIQAGIIILLGLVLILAFFLIKFKQ